MKRNEIFKQVSRNEMPDIEQIRANCHNQAVIEISTNSGKQKKHQIFKPARILATALALVLVIGLFNVQAIIAFVDGLFFIPGVGVTDNPNLISAVLDEPVVMEIDGIEYRLEFATKVTQGNNKNSKLMMFFTTNENTSDIADGVAVINGKEYKLRVDVVVGTTMGIVDKEMTRSFYTFSMVNRRFPNVNEFELRIKNTAINITLSELTDEEKLPNISEEINGITLAAYKYRNNNQTLGFGLIDNNSDSKFTARFSPNPNGLRLYDIDGNIISEAGFFGLGRSTSSNSGFNYNLISFDNSENTNIHKVVVNSINISYHLDDKSWIKIPMPKDSETIYTDIKIPVGGLVYELTAIKRVGDILYVEDNSEVQSLHWADLSGDELREAVNNNTTVIIPRFYGGETVDREITSLDPNYLKIHCFTITYYGDFTIILE